MNLDATVRKVMAKLFVFIFMSLAIAIIFSLVNTCIAEIRSGEEVMQVFIGAINTGIIALAVFELAMVINKEYSSDESDDDAIETVRRTLPRFIGTVSIALALEGLIMVIKYSQLELAGNLYYPVAIITCTALLITSLGLFLFLTRKR